MKRIYIYLPEDGEEYSGGARAELSDKANGNVVAVVASPNIDEIWKEFQRGVNAHSLKIDFANGFIVELDSTLSANKQLPYIYLRKLSDTEWAYAERCKVNSEAAQEFMR